MSTVAPAHPVSDAVQQQIDDFRRYLFELGLHPATITSYATDVRQFHEFLTGMGEGHSTTPTRPHVIRYRTHLLELRLKVATVNKKINSLAAYDRYLNQKGLLTGHVVHPRRDRITVATGSERKVEAFTDEEITRILFHVQQPSCSLRNRLIVEMLLYTGVRVSELCNIQLKDLDLLTHILRVTGKGGTYREIPLRPELVESIQRYLGGERRNSRFTESPYLLLSQRAAKLHRDAVNRLLKTLGDKLGMSIYPHKFRHTFCSVLIRRGVALTTVRKLAGHASIQTTSQFYVHTNREDMEEAVTLL